MGDLMKSFKIVKIVRHNNSLVSLYFEKPFNVSPGQFVLLWLPGVDEKPFSISDVSENLLEISIKAAGPCTKKFKDLKEGDFLGLRGPFGRGFTPSENGLLIGGGIGIAPLRFLAHLLKREKMKPELLFGVNSSSDLIFNAHYQGSPRCTLVSRDDSFPNQGFVTDFIEEIVEKRKIAKIFSAGPEGMLIKVREIAIRSGIPYELSLERYMKCGLGICGQCCLDGSGLRLCVEGPVLAEKEISQITELGKPHRKASGKRASTPRNF